MEVASIDLPSNVSREGHRPQDCLALVLDDVFTPSECQDIIDEAAPNFARPVAASFEMNGQMYHLENTRIHEQATTEKPTLADEMWTRMKERLQPAMAQFAARNGCGPPVGINPRFRVLRYSGDDRFDAHYDGYIKVGSRCSLASVLIYLNSGGGVDFAGGETLFLNTEDPSEYATVEPRVGRVVVFEHTLRHSGSKVLGPSASKLAVRTDLLFQVESPPYAPEMHET
jgi:hypothetical protein